MAREIFRDPPARLTPIRSPAGPDLRISLRRWANYARAAPSIPDEILRGMERSQRMGGFAALDALLRDLTAGGAAVEAVTCFRDISVPITSADQFWALFIADLVLLQSKEGPRKWLIKETGKALRSRDRERVERVRLTWGQIFPAGETPLGVAVAGWPDQLGPENGGSSLNRGSSRMVGASASWARRARESG